GEINLTDLKMQIYEEIVYENSSTNMFTLSNATAEEAMDLLKDQNIVCVVTIPPTFSEAVESLINTTVRGTLTSAIGEGAIPPEIGAQLPDSGKVTAQVLIQGDQSYMTFGAVQSMVIGIMNAYVEGVKSEAIVDIAGDIPGIPTSSAMEYIEVETENIAGTGDSSIFDYFAPGIMVFGLLLGVIAVAESMAKMVEDHTLSRLKISMMNSFDLLFGSLLSWTLFAGFQVLILFAVAVALGFNWAGGSTSLILGLLVGCVVGIACISLGMLIAAFAKNTEQASSLGTLVSIPMSFVIGVFISFPPGLFTKVIAVLPWRQGLLSLHEVLTYGSTLEEVAPNITALVIETAILFAAGVIAFSRFRLKAE
ncbi:MAG: ABC transporter permease, partial [Theionarchaea archaeon]|nr:ABC transporter permease [Theionarchaea archaeon]